MPEVVMRLKPRKEPEMRFNAAAKNPLLAAVYPGLYCPRCGSKEIGLKRLAAENAIWGCRDCMADFRLVFPRNKRF
jgi:ribosomal protein L37AE/L43A